MTSARGPYRSPHHFAMYCDGTLVALELETHSDNPEGEAKLAVAEALPGLCPWCGGDHGIPRVTAEEYERLIADDTDPEVELDRNEAEKMAEQRAWTRDKAGGERG